MLNTMRVRGICREEGEREKEREKDRKESGGRVICIAATFALSTKY